MLGRAPLGTNGREVAKALVIALAIIVRDEGIDLCFEMAVPCVAPKIK